MNRQVWAAVAAAVLAMIGGVLLYLYVQGADRRALAGQEPVNVLVVTTPIERGTTVVAAAAMTEVRQVPASAVVPGAVSAASQLPADTIAAADLLVGEQVVASRFVSPEAEDVSGEVDIPVGMEQVSVQLEPQRVVGARLKPGETVGVIASFTFKDEGEDTSDEIETTHLMLDKVLITRVQGVAAKAEDRDTGTEAEAPTDDIMVTLALSSRDAERVVFAAEFGSIWLTRQGASADPSTAEVTTGGNVFR